jgi:putative transposase
VGYAISRSIDARLTVAALRAALERRKPPTGCVHHSDRGSQYAAQLYRGKRPVKAAGERGYAATAVSGVADQFHGRSWSICLAG